MAILITGGTGWIGSHVVRELVSRDQQVVTFDSTREAWRVQGLPNVQVVKGDILDLPGLLDAVKKHSVTAIVHLAAVLKADSLRNPRLLLKVNCEGTVNVLEVARLAGLSRVIYGSSTVAYGLGTPEPTTEDHPTAPADIYGASKVLGEAYLREYNRLYGLDFAVMRFAHVYGPGRSKGTAVWKDLFEYPARGEPYILPSGGDHQLNWSYVVDCATATVTACLAKRLEERFFNVCEGVRHTPREIAELIASEIVPGARFEIGPGLVPGHPPESTMSVAAAARALDWRPAFDIQRGCEEYIAAVRRKLAGS